MCAVCSYTSQQQGIYLRICTACVYSVGDQRWQFLQVQISTSVLLSENGATSSSPGDRTDLIDCLLRRSAAFVCILRICSVRAPQPIILLSCWHFAIKQLWFDTTGVLHAMIHARQGWSWQSQASPPPAVQTRARYSPSCVKIKYGSYPN